MTKHELNILRAHMAASILRGDAYANAVLAISEVNTILEKLGITADEDDPPAVSPEPDYRALLINLVSTLECTGFRYPSWGSTAWIAWDAAVKAVRQ